jgi:cyanophycinase
MNAGSIGIGLGEDTGMLIREGIGTCVGSGMVIIVDSSQVRNSTKNSVAADEPISVENLIVHALTRGDRFDIEKHQVLARTAETLA